MKPRRTQRAQRPKLYFPVLLACFAAILPVSAADVDTFNYAVGTQTFDPVYQFTTNSKLVETAEAIREMGANVIKFKLGRDYYGKPGRSGNVPEKNPAIRSLTELVRDEPSHRSVLDLPFANYVLWAYSFADHDWHKGFPAEAAEREYREVHELAKYLLTKFSGTGKSFYLGHWEGDWWLRGFDSEKNKGPDGRATPEAIQGMTGWLNTRQRAIEDARRDVRHERVQVWQYTEVNLVKRAMEGAKTVCNDVLPKSRVDFVSYSAYDTQNDPAKLRAALDYIESKLPAKEGIAGRRVFIGEYGFPAVHHTPQQQDAKSRAVIHTALAWGCPFVLYWELYNNEVDDKGQQRGFWLIDDKGVKQPVYSTHQRFLFKARSFVANFERREKRLPSFDEYRKASVDYLRGD